MFFVRNENVVILLFTLTQSLVFAALNNLEKETEPSSRLIVELVNVPLFDGLDWVSDPSESYRAKEVLAFIYGVESGEVWARKMLRALVRIEKKLREVHGQDAGTHDQCMANARQNDIEVEDNRCKAIPLGGKYLIDISEDRSPSAGHFNSISNNKSKVLQIMNDRVQDESFGSKMNLEVNLLDLTITEISTLLLFFTIITFMIACTICDIVRRKRVHGSSSTTIDTLSKFSLHTNALAIMNTKVTSEMMPAIHGIRCLCCFSVVIGHRYLMSTCIFEHRISLLELMELKDSWVSTCITMTTYAVDVFIVLSGFLATRVFLKVMNSGVKSNLIITYLYRYFRLTPCIVILLLVHAIYSNRTKGGTLWRDAIVESTQLCQRSWWVYLIYAQNIIEDTYVCLPHTWYLAVDMQLFWISPIIIYPLHRWPRFGLKLLTLCLLASIVTPAVTLAINGHFTALMRMDVPSRDLVLNFANFYIPTYNRASPYLIGIFLGYYTAKLKTRLTPVNVTINWLVTGVLILLCIRFTDYTYNRNFAYNLGMETACAALSRTLWSVATAWIIYACTQGYGGLITKFLSLPLFFLPSRLAYCIYLVHPGIQIVTLTFSQTPTNYLEIGILCELCGDLVLSITTAFIFSLFVETPVVVLAKILTSRDRELEQAPEIQEALKNKTTLSQSCNNEFHSIIS